MRALIVEHDEREHARYIALLAQSGVSALAAASGDKALTELRGSEPRVGAVIVSWELGGRPTATELLRQLRHEWPDLPVLLFGTVLNVSVAALAHKLGACDFVEKAHLRDRLGPAVLRALAGPRQAKHLAGLRQDLIGESPEFLAMLNGLAAAIPHTDSAVLLIGESGTGKEVLARGVHDLGAPAGSPLCAFNVAALAANLVESELFGHEKGAFTGADRRKAGRFEQCGNGTLFLDEIGELQPALQAKLLRVLQERTFRPVGGTADLPFAGRVVSATNRDLIADVEAGRFRRDLYHRIADVEIRVPPLRERGDDRWRLVEYFLNKFAGGRPLRLAPETRELLQEYPFPGNVRELEKIVRQAVARCGSDVVLPFDLPVEVMDRRQLSVAANDLEALRWPEALFGATQPAALREIERAFNRAYLPRKLQEAGGRKERAAEAAGLDPKTFRSKWRSAGLADGGAEGPEP